MNARTQGFPAGQCPPPNRCHGNKIIIVIHFSCQWLKRYRLIGVYFSVHLHALVMCLAFFITCSCPVSFVLSYAVLLLVAFG